MQPLHSPAEPGTYALLLTATAPLEVVVGRLGACRLPAGHYVYVGSAHGPGGLAARLTHHRPVLNYAPSPLHLTTGLSNGIRFTRRPRRSAVSVRDMCALL
jgi:hypothetical protein